MKFLKETGLSVQDGSATVAYKTAAPVENWMFLDTAIQMGSEDAKGDTAIIAGLTFRHGHDDAITITSDNADFRTCEEYAGLFEDMLLSLHPGLNA